MKKHIAIKLQARAEEVAEIFSKPDREKNHNNETFELAIIRPLSDFAAAVIYEKDTGKRAIAFFYYIDAGDGYWGYFFPKDSHILGMSLFSRFKQEIEEFNFDKNEVKNDEQTN